MRSGILFGAERVPDSDRLSLRQDMISGSAARQRRLRLVPGSTLFAGQASRRFRVAQVDFMPEGDPFSHGRQVGMVLEQALEGRVDIVPFRVRHNGGYYEIGKAVDELYRAVCRGERFDAANISMGNSITLDNLRRVLKLPPDLQDKARLGALQADILKRIARLGKQTPHAPLSDMEREPAGEIARALRQLSILATRYKLPVFVAGGNDGPDVINLLTMARGVRGVGVDLPDGSPWSNGADNPFITDRAPGLIRIENSGNPFTLGPGSSYAAPAALARHLMQTETC